MIKLKVGECITKISNTKVVILFIYLLFLDRLSLFSSGYLLIHYVD